MSPAESPAGLASVRPAFLKRVIALYVLVAVTVLVIPALISKPRGKVPHPNEQQARRPPASDAAANAPGR